MDGERDQEVHSGQNQIDVAPCHQRQQPLQQWPEDGRGKAGDQRHQRDFGAGIATITLGKGCKACIILNGDRNEFRHQGDDHKLPGVFHESDQAEGCSSKERAKAHHRASTVAVNHSPDDRCRDRTGQKTDREDGEDKTFVPAEFAGDFGRKN